MHLLVIKIHTSCLPEPGFLHVCFRDINSQWPNMALPTIKSVGCLLVLCQLYRSTLVISGIDA